MTEQQLQLAAGSEQNLFNGKKLLSRAIDYWYLYVLSLIVCLGYAWFKIHYATPMYKVYGQILVQDDKSGGGSSQALLGGGGSGNDFSSLFSGKVNMENELPIFQTTDLYRKMVKNMKLYISYYHKGQVRATELYKGSPVFVDYHPLNDTISPVTLELKFPLLHSNQFTITTGGKKLLWHFNDTLYLNNASFYFTNANLGFDTTATYLIQIQDPEAVAGSIAGNVSAALLTPKSTIVNLVYNTNLPQKGQDVLAGYYECLYQPQC